MLDLNRHQLQEVKQILGNHLPAGTEVYAFGSRTKQEARKFSDLDLIIKASSTIPYATIAILEEAFSESSLPFKTDMSDWHRISSEFQQHIRKDMIQIHSS